MKRITLLIVLHCFYIGCSDNKPFSKTIKINDSYFTGEVVVEKIEKIKKYKLTIFNSITKESDRIYTPYEIFQMECGDVNRDGKTDICIGIIKPTPFDSIIKKRLFIFQIDRGYIRPLWLSSRLVRPLEEFAMCKDKDGTYIIRAMEKQTKNLYCIDQYKWESFGMSFVKNCEDSLSYSKAHSLLNKMN